MKLRRRHLSLALGGVLLAALLSWMFLRSGTDGRLHDNQPSNPDSVPSPSASDAAGDPAVPVGQTELLDMWRKTDFVLEHLEQAADTSQLPPPCVSFGTVRWTDGSPAPDARIETLITRRHGASAKSWVDTGVRTDRGGNYELPPQRACPLRLAATTTEPHPGRGEEFGPPGEGEIPYRIRRDLTIEPVCPVEGRVLDATGESIESRVAASPNHWLVARLHGFRSSLAGDLPERWRNWAYRTTTDDEGFFAFDALPNSDWTLMAEAEGYEAGIVELSFEAGDCPEPVSFSLEPASCWTASVFDPDSNPIPDAVVWALSIVRSRVGWTGEEVITGPDGKARVCEVPALGSSFEACATGFTCNVTFNYEGHELAEVTLFPAGGAVAEIEPPPPDTEDCSVGAEVAGPASGYTGIFCEVRGGRLRADPIPAGNALLTIRLPGFEKLRVNARISRGQAADLGVLRFEPGGDVEAQDEPWSPWRLW